MDTNNNTISDEFKRGFDQGKKEANAIITPLIKEIYEKVYNQGLENGKKELLKAYGVDDIETLITNTRNDVLHKLWNLSVSKNGETENLKELAKDIKTIKNSYKLRGEIK